MLFAAYCFEFIGKSTKLFFTRASTIRPNYMIVLTKKKCDLDLLLKIGVWLCAAIAFITLIWITCLFIQTRLKEEGENIHKKITFDKNSAAYIYPLEAIASGPLALHPKIACGWISRIAQEFSILAFNSRPDAIQKEAKILIGMRKGKEQITTQNGKMIFLQEHKEGKGLSLSETPTSLWVKPILLDNGNVLVEAGRKLISKTGELVGEEKGEFTVFAATNPILHRDLQIAPLNELKNARYMGQDPLIAKYGGKEYAGWKDKVKILFSHETHSYACFVSSGDFLQYKEGQWRHACAENLLSALPLAHVISSTPKGLEIQAWDETGFLSMPISIAAQKNPQPFTTQELLPSSLRMRSSTQVSCLFGKKRLIVKKGDWLVRTASGWRNLRRAEEIEDCLYHRLKGELFIFDSIEKEQGKWTMHGHLFDIQRYFATPVSLPIDSEKKSSQRHFKKSLRLHGV